MALPIGRTPILRGKTAESFIEKLKADLKKPVCLVPTPKIDTAKKMVLAHAMEIKKDVWKFRPHMIGFFVFLGPSARNLAVYLAVYCFFDFDKQKHIQLVS